MTSPGSQRDAGVGIVIVNYGSHALIETNFSQLTLPQWGASIVIVDNFSSDDEAQKINLMCKKYGFVCVALPSNQGFGAGMNAGVARAIELGCTTLVLVNPDASISTDVVSALDAYCRSRPLSLVSPRVVKPNGEVWFEGGRVLIDEGRTTTSPGTDSSRDDGWLSGACMALSVELWNLVGGFDDDYFLYWEDVDLSWRCRQLGATLAVLHELVVTHSVGGTQESGGKSAVYVYYNCRNRMLFARKHLSASQIRQWRRGSISYAYRVVLRGGRRALLRHPFSLILAAVSGIIAGIRDPLGSV